MPEMMRVQMAQTPEEIRQCRQFVAEIYEREYGTRFSADTCNPHDKVQTWPHRHLMGIIDGVLVASVSLYLHDTYTERHGQVTEADIETLLAHAGAAPRYTATRRRELAKITVRWDLRRKGYARFFLACAHSRDFIQADTHPDEPVVLIGCARKSVWDGLHHDNGIHTRRIKDFPFYAIHGPYRATEPMDSRLIIPELDIPAHWYDRKIPGEYEVEEAIFKRAAVEEALSGASRRPRTTGV